MDAQQGQAAGGAVVASSQLGEAPDLDGGVEGLAVADRLVEDDAPVEEVGDHATGRHRALADRHVEDERRVDQGTWLACDRFGQWVAERGGQGVTADGLVDGRFSGSDRDGRCRLEGLSDDQVVEVGAGIVVLVVHVGLVVHVDQGIVGHGATLAASGGRCTIRVDGVRRETRQGRRRGGVGRFITRWSS